MQRPRSGSLCDGATEKSVYPRTQLCGKNVRDCEAKCEAWPDPAVVVCACVTKIDTVKNTVKRIRILFIGILPVFDSRQQLAGRWRLVWNLLNEAAWTKSVRVKTADPVRVAKCE